jgi:hypothetical protein
MICHVFEDDTESVKGFSDAQTFMSVAYYSKYAKSFAITFMYQF